MKLVPHVSAGIYYQLICPAKSSMPWPARSHWLWLWVKTLHNPVSLKLHVKIRGKLPKSSVELKQYGLFSSTTFDAKDSRGGGQSYQHHIPEQQRWGCLAPFNLGKKQWLNVWPCWGKSVLVCYLTMLSPYGILAILVFLISFVRFEFEWILVTNVVSTIFVSCWQFSVLTLGGTGGR